MRFTSLIFFFEQKISVVERVRSSGNQTIIGPKHGPKSFLVAGCATVILKSPAAWKLLLLLQPASSSSSPSSYALHQLQWPPTTCFRSTKNMLQEPSLTIPAMNCSSSAHHHLQFWCCNALACCRSTSTVTSTSVGSCCSFFQRDSLVLKRRGHNTGDRVHT